MDEKEGVFPDVEAGFPVVDPAFSQASFGFVHGVVGAGKGQAGVFFEGQVLAGEGEVAGLYIYGVAVVMGVGGQAF